MSDPTTTAPAGDPLRALVADWSQAEASRSEDLDQLLSPLEAAVAQLAEWADHLADAEETEAERRQEADAREQAAEDRRRRLEHDLKLSRSRVRDLEQMLQERTEELLRAQAANNALAAELQSVGSDENLDGPYQEATHGEGHADHGQPEMPADDPGGAGVAERFAQLRRT